MVKMKMAVAMTSWWLVNNDRGPATRQAMSWCASRRIRRRRRANSLPGESRRRPNTSRGAVARRSAFTLMELILVIALLVIVASITWMQLKSPWESVRLRSAGTLIQSELGRMRVRAMRTGQTQMFQFQAGQGTYLCQSWQGVGDDQTSMNMSTGFGNTSTPAANQAKPWQHQGQLPDNIQFLGAETQSDARSAMLLSSGGMNTNAASAPILFYPDGTTSTTHVVLTNARQQCVVVSIRGITGQTRVSDVKGINEVRQ